MKLLFSCRAAKEKAKHKEAQKAAKVRKEVVVWLGGAVSQLPTPADALYMNAWLTPVCKVTPTPHNLAVFYDLQIANCLL